MSKTVLITGATDGIGKQTALELLRLGWTVIVHGRSAQKVKKVSEELEQESGKKPETAVGDFARLAEVRALADDIKRRFKRLDVLLNNAGIYAKRREETEDGLESTFQVNHLAPFLLTKELLPLMEKSAPARIVNVSSMAHASGDLDFDDLQMKRGFSGYSAYANSKLANVLFTQELAERLDPKRVTANSLHPGVISTKLLRTGFGIGGADLAEGAKTSVFAATSPELEGVTGRYLNNARLSTASSGARNKAAQKQLWEVSERLVEQAASRR